MSEQALLPCMLSQSFGVSHMKFGTEPELRSLTSFVLLMSAWRRISACCLAVSQSCFSTASANPGNSRCA